MIAVSGDKYVEQKSRETVATGLAGVSTYQTIEIDPRADRLSYRAWTEEGRVVDAFQIDKGQHDQAPTPQDLDDIATVP